MEKKVLSLREYRVGQVMAIAEKVMDQLDEFDETPVWVTMKEINVIIEEFYRYYQKRHIEHAFIECIGGHFYDMGIDAMKYDHPFDLEFVLGELRLYELLDSPLAVHPRDTKRIIKGIQKKLTWR